MRRRLTDRRSFGHNVGWTLVGQGVYALCQWLVLVVLARLAEPRMLGEYALALAVATPVFAFSSLNSRGIQASDVGREFAFHEYLHLRYITTLLALATTTLIGFAYTPQIASLVLLVGLTKACDSLADCYYALFQRSERMSVISRGMMFNGAGTLGGVALLLWLTNDLLWVAGGSLCASASVWVYVSARARSLEEECVSRMRVRGGRVADLALLASPLALVSLLGALQPNIPRYFLQAFGGATHVGIFSALAYLTLLADTVGSSVLQPALPRLAVYYVTDRPRFRRWVLSLLAIGVVVGAAATLLASAFGHLLLTIVYGERFGMYGPVLVILAACSAVALLGSVLTTAGIAARYLRSQVGVASVGTLTGLVSGAVLIPLGGLSGAAATLLLIALAKLAAQVEVVRRSLRDSSTLDVPALASPRVTQ